MKPLFHILITLVVYISITACSSILPDAHKIDVQQGNSIKAENLDKLELGMTRKQVQFLLGTPIIMDIFHNDRWDYVHTFKPGGGTTKTMRLTLFFDNDKLSKIDNVNYVGEK